MLIPKHIRKQKFCPCCNQESVIPWGYKYNAWIEYKCLTCNYIYRMAIEERLESHENNYRTSQNKPKN